MIKDIPACQCHAVQAASDSAVLDSMPKVAQTCVMVDEHAGAITLEARALGM